MESSCIAKSLGSCKIGPCPFIGAHEMVLRPGGWPILVGPLLVFIDPSVFVLSFLLG